MPNWFKYKFAAIFTYSLILSSCNLISPCALSKFNNLKPIRIYFRQHTFLMSTKSIIQPSIKQDLFDKTRFNEKIPLVALSIPSKLSKYYLDGLSDYLFNRRGFKRVYKDVNDPDRRLIILSEKFQSLQLENILPKDIIDKYVTDDIHAEIFTLDISYDNYTVDEVLRKLLPPEIVEIPSSFEQAGHIAHLNLRDEVLPFKYIIGQVILEKNFPNIKTVVNKVGQIETEFRTFPMELIAGDDNMIVILKESNARLKFNFKEVYWNSRLQMEHLRLVTLIQSSTGASKVVADMMAGVGPFAIPLATLGVSVYANDLNPVSYKYIEENKKLNNCGKLLKCYNMDGRDFILKLAEEKIIVSEIIMNLPQNATDFLDIFIGYGKRLGSIYDRNCLPRIHCYAFSTADDPILDIAKRVSQMMNCLVDDLNYKELNFATKKKSTITIGEVPRDICWGHIVRDVAPKKVMVCLTFQLPYNVAEVDASLTSSNMIGKRKLENFI